jgi:hypothetical protein
MGSATTSSSTRPRRGALKAAQTVGVVLYAITLAGQWFAAVVRVLSAYIILALIALITGWPIPSSWIALGIGFGPLIVSLLALLIPPLIAPLDGRWWEISSRGRPPEQDEQEAFERAIEELREYHPKLRVPRHWFVADAYAARLGQGPALARALEYDAMPYDRPIPRMRYSRASHPYTKQRIARLRAHPQPPAGDQQ